MTILIEIKINDFSYNLQYNIYNLQKYRETSFKGVLKLCKITTTCVKYAYNSLPCIKNITVINNNPAGCPKFITIKKSKYLDAITYFVLRLGLV